MSTALQSLMSQNGGFDRSTVALRRGARSLRRLLRC